MTAPASPANLWAELAARWTRQPRRDRPDAAG